MATQTVERQVELAEQETVPEPKNGIQGWKSRKIVAFNNWRHQDFFDTIFSDWFFENNVRGGKCYSSLVEGDDQRHPN